MEHNTGHLPESTEDKISGGKVLQLRLITNIMKFRQVYPSLISLQTFCTTYLPNQNLKEEIRPMK